MSHGDSRGHALDSVQRGRATGRSPSSIRRACHGLALVFVLDAFVGCETPETGETKAPEVATSQDGPDGSTPARDAGPLVEDAALSEDAGPVVIRSGAFAEGVLGTGLPQVLRDP